MTWKNNGWPITKNTVIIEYLIGINSLQMPFYPVHCARLTPIQPTWSAYPCHLVFLKWYPYSLVLLIWYPCSLFSLYSNAVQHLNGNANVLDRACYWLLWTLHCSKGRYSDATMIKPLLCHGIRSDLSESPGAAIVDRQSINHLLDFKVICCIFPWNNSMYVIKRNRRLGRVLGVINKCSGLRPSDTLSSFWLGWRYFNYVSCVVTPTVK